MGLNFLTQHTFQFYYLEIFLDFPLWIGLGVTTKCHSHKFVQITDMVPAKFHGLWRARVSPLGNHRKLINERLIPMGNGKLVWFKQWLVSSPTNIVILGENCFPWKTFRYLGIPWLDLKNSHKQGWTKKLKYTCHTACLFSIVISCTVDRFDDFQNMEDISFFSNE